LSENFAIFFGHPLQRSAWRCRIACGGALGRHCSCLSRQTRFFFGIPLLMPSQNAIQAGPLRLLFFSLFSGCLGHFHHARNIRW
jgi:hypothetical protein